MTAEITLPAFAIGGVKLDNLPRVLEAGCTRVAVSSAITAAENPGEVVRQFRERLFSTSPQPC